jgi:hypothetical protein
MNPMSDHWLSEATRLQAENENLRAEVERLTRKADLQADMLRRLDAEKFPGTYFIHSGLGEKDHNGMPEKLLVVPAFGVDFSYVYEYTGKTTGPEW